MDSLMDDDLLADDGQLQDADGLDDLDLLEEEALLGFSDEEDKVDLDESSEQQILDEQEVEYVDEEGNPVEIGENDNVEVFEMTEGFHNNENTFTDNQDDDVLEVEIDADLDSFSQENLDVPPSHIQKEKIGASAKHPVVPTDHVTDAIEEISPDKQNENVKKEAGENFILVKTEEKTEAEAKVDNTVEEQILNDNQDVEEESEEENQGDEDRRKRFKSERHNVVTLTSAKRRSDIPESLDSVITAEEAAKVDEFLAKERERKMLRRGTRQRGRGRGRGHVTVTHSSRGPNHGVALTFIETQSFVQVRPDVPVQPVQPTPHQQTQPTSPHQVSSQPAPRKILINPHFRGPRQPPASSSGSVTASEEAFRYSSSGPHHPSYPPEVSCPPFHPHPQVQTHSQPQHFPPTGDRRPFQPSLLNDSRQPPGPSLERPPPFSQGPPFDHRSQPPPPPYSRPAPLPHLPEAFRPPFNDMSASHYHTNEPPPGHLPPPVIGRPNELHPPNRLQQPPVSDSWCHPASGPVGPPPQPYHGTSAATPGVCEPPPHFRGATTPQQPPPPPPVSSAGFPNNQSRPLPHTYPPPANYQSPPPPGQVAPFRPDHPPPPLPPHPSHHLPPPQFHQDHPQPFLLPSPSPFPPQEFHPPPQQRQFHPGHPETHHNHSFRGVRGNQQQMTAYHSECPRSAQKRPPGRLKQRMLPAKQLKLDNLKHRKGRANTAPTVRKPPVQNSNIKEVPLVDMLPVQPAVKKPLPPEDEDEETKDLRKKIEEQKKLREQILKHKEERRRQRMKELQQQFAEQAHQQAQNLEIGAGDASTHPAPVVPSKPKLSIKQRVGIPQFQQSKTPTGKKRVFVVRKKSTEGGNKVTSQVNATPVGKDQSVPLQQRLTQGKQFQSQIIQRPRLPGQIFHGQRPPLLSIQGPKFQGQLIRGPRPLQPAHIQSGRQGVLAHFRPRQPFAHNKVQIPQVVHNYQIRNSTPTTIPHQAAKVAAAEGDIEGSHGIRKVVTLNSQNSIHGSQQRVGAQSDQKRIVNPAISKNIIHHPVAPKQMAPSHMISKQVSQSPLTGKQMSQSSVTGKQVVSSTTTKEVGSSAVIGKIMGSSPVVSKPIGPSVGTKQIAPSVGVKQMGPSVGVKQMGPSVGVKQMGPSGVKQIGPSVGVKQMGPSIGVKQMGPSPVGAKQIGQPSVIAKQIGSSPVSGKLMNPSSIAGKHMGPSSIGRKQMGLSSFAGKQMGPSSVAGKQIGPSAAAKQINPLAGKQMNPPIGVKQIGQPFAAKQMAPTATGKQISPSPIGGKQMNQNVTSKQLGQRIVVLGDKAGCAPQQQRTVIPAKTNFVVVENLSASTNENQLVKLCSSIGPVECIQLQKKERKAVIKFKDAMHATIFQKKYQRYMLDLAMIQVSLLCK